MAREKCHVFSINPPRHLQALLLGAISRHYQPNLLKTTSKPQPMTGGGEFRRAMTDAYSGS